MHVFLAKIFDSWVNPMDIAFKFASISWSSKGHFSEAFLGVLTGWEKLHPPKKHQPVTGIETYGWKMRSWWDVSENSRKL